MKFSNPRKWWVPYPIPYPIQFDILGSNEQALVEICSFLEPDDMLAAVEALRMNQAERPNSDDSILERASKMALVRNLKTAEKHWETCWEATAREVPTTIDDNISIFQEDFRINQVFHNLELIVENDSSFLDDLLRLSRQTRRSKHRVYGRPSQCEDPDKAVTKMDGETWHDLYSYFKRIVTYHTVSASIGWERHRTEDEIVATEVLRAREAGTVISPSTQDIAMAMWLIFGTPSLPMSLFFTEHRDALHSIHSIAHSSAGRISQTRCWQMIFDTPSLPMSLFFTEHRDALHSIHSIAHSSAGRISQARSWQMRDRYEVETRQYMTFNYEVDTALLTKAFTRRVVKLVKKAYEHTQHGVNTADSIGEIDENIDTLIIDGKIFACQCCQDPHLFVLRDLNPDFEPPFVLSFEGWLFLSSLLRIYRDAPDVDSYGFKFNTSMRTMTQQYSYVSNWLDQLHNYDPSAIFRLPI